MLKTESYKKGIVLSTGLNIIVKAILLLNTVVIAWYFGTSIDTDLYFYIFSTITLIAGLVNGMDLAVVLPEGMHLREEKGEEAAIRFYNLFGFCYLLLGILIFIVLFFFAVPIYSMISSYKTPVLSDHKNLLLLSSVLPLLIILSNYFTSVLTTLKYFTAPLIANGIAQLFALGSLLIFHDKFGIVSVLIGMVAGYFLNIALLLFFMYFKLQWSPGFSAKDITQRVKKNLASVQLGNLATFAFNYGIILVLSSLPIGIYSAYNYSMQILNVPINFIVAQAAAVAGIKFNELSAKNLPAEMNRIFLQSIDILLFLIVPFCCLAYLYADVIVNFLYLRGGFTKDAAEKVVYFMRYLIFLSPCLTINTLNTRVLTAGKKVSQTFFFQLGFNISALMLIILVTRTFGEQGFIISMLAAYYFYVMVVCIFSFRWLMPFIKYPVVIKNMLLIFLYNLPFLWIFYEIFDRDQPVHIFLAISVLYYAAILIINHFIKINKAADSYFSNILGRLSLNKK
ncbi:MAG: lipid II flippase MurJ [Ferruginibacter sp.]